MKPGRRTLACRAGGQIDALGKSRTCRGVFLWLLGWWWVSSGLGGGRGHRFGHRSGSSLRVQFADLRGLVMQLGVTFLDETGAGYCPVLRRAEGLSAAGLPIAEVAVRTSSLEDVLLCVLRRSA